MRRLRALLPLLALAAVLAGCTGTTENVPPLLLAVGRLDPTSGTPEMVLVEDHFPNQPRLTVVAGSTRPLTYAAVASDVVDRTGTRSSVVVLTRDLSVPAGPSPAPASRLLTFNLQGIRPGSPTAFTQDSALQLTGGTNPVFTATSAGPGPWCFSGVTVSRNGRYVTLLDDPSACGNTSSPLPYPRLFQLDTAASPVTVTAVQPAAGSQPVQATVPFDDQASSSESLDFLVAGVNDALVYSDPVPHQSSTAPSNYVARLATQQQTVLLGNGSDLIAITNQDPYGSPPTTTSSYLEAVDLGSPGTPSQVDTVAGARAMAVDPQAITKQVVVAGATSLAVHADPTDSNPTETTSFTLTGVAAAIDPINQFAYVVDDNRITVLDLLAVASSSSSWYMPFSVPLALPVSTATGLETTTVAWTRAAP